MSYTFYTDAGHGWLAVPEADILALPELVGKISSCSYIDIGTRTVYLEEDCDATAFQTARHDAGLDCKVGEVVNAYGDSFVRRLDSVGA